MNAYQVMTQKHQQELAAFPLVYGFGEKQINEGMKKLGLKPSERNKIVSYFGVGDFMRKTDVPALEKLLLQQHREMETAIASDETGDGFIYDMVSTVLSDHEYGYTRDLTDSLGEIGMTVEEINKDKRFLRALGRAIKKQVAFYEKTQKQQV